jgi:hypothetical protein
MRRPGEGVRGDSTPKAFHRGFLGPRGRERDRVWQGIVGVASHTRGMGTDGPVVPGWVVPTQRQVWDLYWLAFGVHLATRDEESGAQRPGGVFVTVLWVVGASGIPGPITGRSERPVTKTVARAEFFAAAAAVQAAVGRVTVSDRIPLADVCAGLGVAYWPVLEDGCVERVRGVGAALAWLGAGQDGRTYGAPLPIPARNTDGSIPTVEQLYERAVTGAPFRYEPEERVELRRRLSAEVDGYRRSAELIAQTQRRWVAGMSV